MRHPLRSVVAVTGLGSLACGVFDSGMLGGDGTTSNPPDPGYTQPMPADLPPHTSPLPDTAPGNSGSTLNPNHAEHGSIYVGYGDRPTCFVHLPFKGEQSSWQPPETLDVDCPPEIHDAAWLECRGGTISEVDGSDACICHVDGNPPPPSAWVHCPATG